MKNISSRIAIAAVSLAALFSSTSHASVMTEDFSGLGAQSTSNQITWNFDVMGGSAMLDFELAGFKSLDGYKNCCSDVFHLWVNDTEVFTGSFNLGGGGSNKVLFNPNGGTAFTTTFDATGDQHKSTQATWAGGITQISLPVDLLSGANQIAFSYTGNKQGLSDEGWGINLASLTSPSTSSTSVPEPNTLILLMAGMLGMIALRRRNI